MKKISLLVLFVFSLQSTIWSQAVIGTVSGSSSSDAKILQFQTDGTLRASWLGSGTLLFGITTDASPSVPQKVVLHNTDLKLENASEIYLQPSYNIYSGTYASPSTSCYLRLNDGGSNDIYMNAKRIMWLQQATTTQPVMVCLPTTTTIQTRDKLQVGGVVNAYGYVASITSHNPSDSTVANGYTITNDEYTILADASGSTTGLTSLIRLPVATSGSPVSAGRIFVIKNVGSTGTIKVDVTGTSGTIDGASFIKLTNPNSSIIVQYNGSSSYYILGSY